MYLRRVLQLLFVPLVLIACSDDPLPTDGGNGEDGATEDLTVDLTPPDHVHIYSEVDFAATITDDAGDPVTDFDSVRVEYRPSGEDSWTGTVDLDADGDAYSGAHTFTSSGDYDLRVVGRRPDDEAAVEMHRPSEALQAVRAHTDAGGYAVEFEAFPGHIHQGDVADLRFWVMEQGDQSPVPDLTPDIHVVEADDSEETVAASETDDGVYEAEHTFGSAGDATVTLQFTGTGGESAEATFSLPVSEAH